jgi:hypothetical protein
MTKLAFDRASVRRVDVDGRLHVAMSNISMAAVNPYLGREIPGAESLGLDPDRVYMLLRDPGELAKAAGTFNNLPLLARHVPVTADDHQPGLVVGSTGTDAVFEAPYLKNSLVIWQAVAIAGIESGEQCELSSAYRYTPVMTPGVYEGVAYDGVMTNIQGNHVALVEVGRAGPSVVVGDANPFIQPPTEHPPMKNPKRVARLTAALIAGLAPLMALDASLKPDEFAGKLALALDAAEPDEDDKKKPAADSDEQGPDESDEDYKKRMAEKEKPAADADKDDKAAMDAAIAAAVSVAETSTVKRMNAIRQAEKEVQPLIGEVVAQDSAEAVYKLALDHAKVDLTGVPEAAYGAMVRMLGKPAEKSPRVAMDAASTTDFAARFPTAGKLIRS